jgi:hypothetical protein
MAAAEEEGEDYQFFGTPIGDEEESRQGQHRKDVRDPAATRALPLHKQVWGAAGAAAAAAAAVLPLPGKMVAACAEPPLRCSMMYGPTLLPPLPPLSACRR